MINNTLFRPTVIKANRKKFNPEGFDLAAALKKRKAAEAVKAATPPTADFDVQKNYITSFSDTQPVECISTTSVSDLDVVIRAAYRQVFGNAHLMESERAVIAESQLRKGEITVLEFVRQLAKSDRYRAVFFENCPNIRAVELNFKHLLGRAPENNAEISQHIQILAEGGFDAEIDAYLDSDEYFQAFGTDIVPYYRGHKTQTGKSVSGFTHSSQLVKGASSSDKSIESNTAPQIQAGLLGGTPTEIKPLATLPFSTPVIPPQEYKQPEKELTKEDYIPVYKSASFLAKPVTPSEWVKEYNAKQAAATFPAARSSQPVKLYAGAGNEDKEILIRTAYKQVFGNVHLMESQRLLTAESQFKDGTLTVKEFVRALAKSDAYRALFFESCSNVRAVELNFKHLLGRAPDNFKEVSKHLGILAEGGLGAEIDSYFDSPEYDQNFGADTVPYYVSYATQTGKNVAGYNRIFELVKGLSSSDRSISDSIQTSQRSQLQKDLVKTFKVKQENVFNPKGFQLAKVIGAPVIVAKQDAGSPSIITAYTDSFADQKPIELVAGDSTGQIDLVIEAAYKQVFGNAHLMESERFPIAESQLRNGDITVLEFVRSLAKSDRYRTLFYERCTNLKTVELNFKHLLGRAPESGAEISKHIQILAEQGFYAEIDSYLDSDEYFQTFGASIVPYFRGYQTQMGKGMASYTHSFQLLRGASSSDKQLSQYGGAAVDQAILSNKSSRIPNISEQTVPVADTRPQTQPPVPVVSPDYSFNLEATSSLSTVERTAIWQGQYSAFANTAPVKLNSGASDEDVELVIAAVYKQVLGNAHVMESERLTKAESQLRNGDLTVREFVRTLAKSDLYKSLFIENSPRYRCHELNFKHLLGRAPESYDETVYHSAIVDNQGYDADIDAYIDSEEYRTAFGEDIVPFYRGYKTQTGKNLLGYINMFDMLTSVSTSDKAGSNQARVEKRLSYENPAKVQPVTDGNLLIQKMFGLI
ncbi:phycobilisome linker polypeptide [Leptolyngbya sp. Heron Island J]|uniref:phycobilisome rod-core linker polypeptide n=1 Tax=Leptolyngbya sp. Heron Island J TaxID=1385935 RepID=UPI0003B973B3|nr:phycobilisome rod-core linker polypeptide [Leptolyngbya sp. Heron Island J]ESA36351.1 phycobilisome linker polypeptide [Leptolyngbya sp. Heron Island J]